MSSLKQEAKCEEVKAKCLLKHLVIMFIMFTLTPACVLKLTHFRGNILNVQKIKDNSWTTLTS